MPELEYDVDADDYEAFGENGLLKIISAVITPQGHNKVLHLRHRWRANTAKPSGHLTVSRLLCD